MRRRPQPHELKIRNVKPPILRASRVSKLLKAVIEMRLAIEGGEPVGCIRFGMLYSGLGHLTTLCLKEIFVSAKVRGRGAGHRSLSVLAEILVERGCQRIDWSTSRDNHSARQFYEAIGATAQEDKIGYRLEGAAMSALVASGKS